MEEPILDFGFKRIIRTSYAKHLSSRSAFGVWVTSLNHKVLNHSMEQCAIIIPLLCQLQEVVAVDGCLVIQANYDVAQHSLNLNFHLLIF